MTVNSLVPYDKQLKRAEMAIRTAKMEGKVLCSFRMPRAGEEAKAWVAVLAHLRQEGYKIRSEPTGVEEYLIIVVDWSLQHERE